MSLERRPLFPQEEPEAATGRYGCPMLVRTRFSFVPGGPPLMRCSLGWALHDDLEVARCQATDVLTDCWKVHPERTPVVADAAANTGVAGITVD